MPTVLDKKTTDLEVIRKRPHLYTWGEVIKIHEIGEYAVVESKREDEIHFSSYVDGICCGCSSDTLDGAILNCFSYKYEGLNSQFPYYAYHMLRMGEKEG